MQVAPEVSLDDRDVHGDAGAGARRGPAVDVLEHRAELAFERHGTSDEARWVRTDEVEALGALPYVLAALGLSAK